MRRISAILILSAMLISAVAPFMGAKDNTIKTDVAAQTETTNQLENQAVDLRIQNAIKSIEEKTTELKNEQANSELEEDEKCSTILNYNDFNVPSNSGFKSFMSYKTITSKSSKQYILQSRYAYTGNYGIRQVNGRYCIAIGTFSNATIGTYVDLILENNSVIPCIIGDFKAETHTDSSNIITTHNGCVSEFIVDKSVLNRTAKQMGDISYCEQNWRSPVVTIRIYEENVFN